MSTWELGRYRLVSLVLAPGSVSNIFIGKLLCTVLGAGAGVERRRAKPVDPAGEVSCAGG